jgi:hypothetical protein
VTLSGSASFRPLKWTGRLSETGTVQVAGLAATMGIQNTSFTAYASASLGTNSVQVKATDYSNNARTNTYELVVTNNGLMVLPGPELGQQISLSVRWGASPKYAMKKEIDERDELGCTQLFRAVADEDIGEVRRLLDGGADPNRPENNGITPLMDAASGGSVKLVRLLLRHGADPTLQDNFGDSAAVYAEKQSFLQVAKILREAERSAGKKGGRNGAHKPGR